MVGLIFLFYRIVYEPVVLWSGDEDTLFLQSLTVSKELKVNEKSYNQYLGEVKEERLSLTTEDFDDDGIDEVLVAYRKHNDAYLALYKYSGMGFYKKDEVKLGSIGGKGRQISIAARGDAAVAVYQNKEGEFTMKLYYIYKLNLGLQDTYVSKEGPTDNGNIRVAMGNFYRAPYTIYSIVVGWERCENDTCKYIVQAFDTYGRELRANVNKWTTNDYGIEEHHISITAGNVISTTPEDYDEIIFTYSGDKDRNNTTPTAEIAVLKMTDLGLQEIAHKECWEAPSENWQDVECGNFGGDDLEEIVFVGEGGRSQLVISLIKVTNTEIEIKSMKVYDNVIYHDRKRWTHEGVLGCAVADFDNDGYGEIIVGFETPSSKIGSTPRYKVLDVDPSNFSLIEKGDWKSNYRISANTGGYAFDVECMELEYKGEVVKAEGIIDYSVVVKDINDDGKLEIFFACDDGNGDGKGMAYGYDCNWNLLPGWPQEVQGNIGANPTIADIDQDGEYEIIMSTTAGYLYVFNEDGTNHSSFPKYCNCKWSSPAVGDVDNDGELEIVIGSEDGKVYEFNPDGSYKTTEMEGKISAGIVIADYDRDGIPEWRTIEEGKKTICFVGPWDCIYIGTPAVGEFVSYGEELISNVYCEVANRTVFVIHSRIVELTVETWCGWKRELGGGALYTSPAIGDVDNDGEQEIIVSGPIPETNDLSQGIIIFEKNCGNIKRIIDTEQDDSYPRSSPALGDIDNDGELEIVVGSDAGVVYAYNYDGTLVNGWPKYTNLLVAASPVIADIDADGKIEVIVGSEDRYIHCWEAGNCTPGKIEWGEFQHDRYNTGNYDLYDLYKAPSNLEIVNGPSPYEEKIIRWIPPHTGMAIKQEIQYTKNIGFENVLPRDITSIIVDGNVREDTIKGLEPCSYYSFRVRAISELHDTSEWSTEAITFTAPQPETHPHRYGYEIYWRYDTTESGPFDLTPLLREATDGPRGWNHINAGIKFIEHPKAICTWSWGDLKYPTLWAKTEITQIIINGDIWLVIKTILNKNIEDNEGNKLYWYNKNTNKPIKENEVDAYSVIMHHWAHWYGVKDAQSPFEVSLVTFPFHFKAK